MLAYSGVSTSNPIDVSGGQTASSSANLTAPSVVTTVANAMLVGLYGMNGVRTLTQPAGMAERLEVANANGEKVTSEAADVVKATAGATGNKVATSASAGKNVGQLIALRPGSGAPAPGPNPPVIDSVVINQSSPTTNQLLSATVTSHDPDPGDVVSYSYQWKRNGTTVGTASTLDLSTSGNGDKGDSITLQVTGSDGAHTGNPLTSAAVIVVNSPPSATVSLNTSAPTTNQILTATATISDADSADVVMLTYVWKKNGNVMQTSQPTTSLTDTYDLSVPMNGDAGDVISVEVTPDDGTVAGSLVSASATVAAATAPVVTIVSAVPSALGPSDLSTNITWHASANGTYSVRVGGTDCSTGTQVATGSYSTSPANVVTNILASQLAEGANTIRVCVTDAVPSTGSATTTVTKNTTGPGTITFRSASSAVNGPANSLLLPVPAGVARTTS